MRLPNLPKCSIGLEDCDYKFLDSLEGKVDYVDIVRIEDDSLHVLGSKDGFFTKAKYYVEIIQNRASGEVNETSFREVVTFGNGLATVFTLGLYLLIPSIRQGERLKNGYIEKLGKYERQNLREIEDKVKDIKVYQGTIDEVQRELGRPLERVNTNHPETFLKASDTFWLRVKAYQLGADAVVHYQPGSAIGTPVKYKKSEK